MNEKKQPTPILYEDVIDFKAIIQTIWQKKGIILGGAIVMSILAAILYHFLVPAIYQADAYVSVTEPAVKAELESSIIISPVQPDTNALVKLAASEEIQQEVFELLDIGVQGQEDYELKSALQGWSQIHLQGKAQDPQLAALITNTWADVIVRRFNELYGSGEGVLPVLESEVEKSRIDWEQTQGKLEIYLSQSQIDVLEVQLTDKKNSLARYLVKLEENQILVSDCETLKAQFVSLDPESDLLNGSVLSIIALQQRASGDISGTQFQIEGQGIFGEGYSAELGLRDLENLILAKGAQNQDLLIKISQIETEISTLALAYEKEKFLIDQLTQDRDLARNAFTALSNQLEETTITLTQEEVIVRLGAGAVVPAEPSSLSALVIAILAFSLGILIISAIVLAVSWWVEK